MQAIKLKLKNESPTKTEQSLTAQNTIEQGDSVDLKIKGLEDEKQRLLEMVQQLCKSDADYEYVQSQLANSLSSPSTSHDEVFTRLKHQQEDQPPSEEASYYERFSRDSRTQIKATNQLY